MIKFYQQVTGTFLKKRYFLYYYFFILRYKTDYDFNTGVATLKIDGAQSNDLGNYTVYAENPAGSDKTGCSVSVTFVPNVDETPLVNPDAFRYLEQHPAQKRRDKDREPMAPPKVIVPLSNAKLCEGAPVHLACKIEGLPKPIVWKKNYLFFF
jgi:hypothetical protein